MQPYEIENTTLSQRLYTPILHPYIAGALLIAAELLGPAGPELDPEQISQLFDLAWRQRDHRDKMIRHATLALLPTMALHCAESRWRDPEELPLCRTPAAFPLNPAPLHPGF